MNLVIVTQARIGSSRLPGKILLEVNGMTLLEIHLHRISQATHADKIIVATTNEPGIEVVDKIVKQTGLNIFHGSLEDVLDRFYQAVQPFKPDYIVRLTSDCPLIDPVLIDKVIEYTLEHKLDYCSNALEEKYPDGQDIEVFTYQALHDAWTHATLLSDREHVTPYIRKNSSILGGTLFRAAHFDEGLQLGMIRMTVDEEADFEVISSLINQLGIDADMGEYVKCIQEDRHLGGKNEHIKRNEGYQKSLNNDNKL